MNHERRRDTRVAINQDFQTIDDFVAEYATNISVSGCFIRSKHPLPVGTRVNLKFTVIAQDIDIIEGTGEVVSVVRNPASEAGMGVRFMKLTPETKLRIEALVTAQAEAET